MSPLSGNWLIACLLFTVPCIQGFLICQHTVFEVRVQMGAAALLPCNFSSSSMVPKDKKAVWQREQKSKEIEVVYFQNGKDRGDQQSAAFVGRTSMLKNWFEEGDAHLQLQNVSVEDAGKYNCLVLTYPVGPKSLYNCSTVWLVVDPRKGNQTENESKTGPAAGLNAFNIIVTLLLTSLIFFLVWIFMLATVSLVVRYSDALKNSSPDYYGICQKSKFG